MRFVFRTAVFFVGFLFSGCQCQHPLTGAGLSVRIDVEDALAANCIVLELRNTDGLLLEKTQLKRVPAKKSYLVGISEGLWPANVRLKARAMNGVNGCTEPLVAVFEGEDKPESFVAGQVKQVVLALSCSTQAEKCDDGIDNNCNGAIDCADPTCDARTCAGGGTCQSSSCSCAAGTRACNGACISAASCCGDVECAAVTGQSCQSGACACAAGQKVCGADCIAASTCCTSADCIAPIIGQTCQSGSCACPAGQKICGSACIPSASCCDSAECAAVVPGQICSAETCVCPAGQRVCAGLCAPGTGCCVSTDCGTAGTCAVSTGLCSCGAGTKLCNNVCIPAANCCAAADCATPPACRTATAALCSSGTCAYPAATAGVACGSAVATACNDADSCDGAGSCIDRVKPATTVCRAAGANPACDPAETCNGVVATCPANAFSPVSTACGSADSTGCNAADSCSGTGLCVDRVKASATVCRAAGANVTCDPAELCDGTTALCPANAFSSSSTACGSADNSACNAPDSCNGAGGCVDRVKAATTVCRPAGASAACDPAETCDGLVASCPANGFGAASTACGSSDATDCNAADSCDGAGVCVDQHKPATFVCRAAGASAICDPAESCTGSSPTCPADSFATNGTACAGGNTCQAGACSSFKYTPSNFDPSLLTPVGNLLFDCGVSVFNSTTLTFSNWCGEVQPVPVVQVQSSGPDLVILPMISLMVVAGNTVQIVGNRPVVLAVFSDANILGAVTADAVTTVAGPGGSSTACGTSNGNPGMQSGNSGGGAGGAGFGTDGESGEVSGSGGAKGLKGLAGGNATLVPLRGGCSGGRGGTGTAPGGLGGGGGGAVQISAGGNLVIAGRISALGGGGRGGASRTGGGGGGSGGAILLEGDSITYAVTARLSANGGGGGEGGDDGGNSGNPGDDATSPTVSAMGGMNGANSGGNGGNGGRAGLGPTAGFAGTSGDGGGGGGGGAVGRITVNAHTSCTLTVGSLSSPAPTGNAAAGCPGP